MTKINLGLNEVGKASERFKIHRLKSKQIVRNRILKKGSKCEGCNDKLLKSPDWAHLFGRRNIIKEPLASMPELTVGLDRKCHDAMDRSLDLELRARLRWSGLEIFANNHNEFGDIFSEFSKERTDDIDADDRLALDCARAFERKFEELEKANRAPEI